MKTNTTWKLMTLGFVLLLTIVACKKNDPAPKPQPEEVKIMTITELRALSTGASVKLPDGRKIKGTVISDAASKNIDAKTVVLQEATDKVGIIITFDAAQSYSVGDELEVTVSNQILAQANGEIVLQDIPVANAKKIGTGTITARTTTIADINANKKAWNGTLVSIGAGLFSGTGKYTGTLAYTSESASIKTVISTGASFENTEYPALVNSLTGIVRISGNEVFINLRNKSDVKQSDSFVLSEDFSGSDLGEYTPFRALAVNKSPFSRNLTTTIGTKTTGEQLDIFSFNHVSISSYVGLVKNLSVNSMDPDAAIMVPGKNYLSMLPITTEYTLNRLKDSENSWYGGGHQRFTSAFALSRSNGTDDKDYFEYLKSITVIFAISKMQVSNFDPTAILFKDITTSVFDASKDGIYASLTTGSKKLDSSPVYSDEGKWHTYTFSDVNSKVKKALESGSFSSLNLSFACANLNVRGKFFAGFRGNSEILYGSPVIIDKIIFEFSQKPDWAK